MKPGEKLIRQLIAELNTRLAELERQTAAGKISAHYHHYRLRWLREDYNKLEGIAKRCGFNTE